MDHVTPTAPPDIRLDLDAGLPGWTADYIRAKTTRLLRHLHRPVLSARVRITRHPDPAVKRAFTAQANLDIDGRLIRAQVAASTPREAIDLLDARLRQRLVSVAEHWEARRGAMPSVERHEWRHGEMPTHRPPYFPRPPRQRQIVSRKSVAPDGCTCDDAALDMDAMDYDFYLFSEVGSGQDSVLYRAGETGYRLAQVAPAPDRLRPGYVPITVSARPAPLLTVREATERLDATGYPFVFFLDAERVRGSVVYRRYDGHYGWITPAG